MCKTAADPTVHNADCIEGRYPVVSERHPRPGRSRRRQLVEAEAERARQRQRDYDAYLEALRA